MSLTKSLVWKPKVINFFLSLVLMPVILCLVNNSNTGSKARIPKPDDYHCGHGERDVAPW